MSAVEHEVRPGQVYEGCDPRDSIRIRVVSVAADSADVVDAVTGKRPRSVLLRSLHDSGTRPDGKRRRTGYRLLRDAPGSDR